MTEILTLIQTFSPMATIALSLFVILMLVKNKRANSDGSNSLKTNHLHEIVEALGRIERQLEANSLKIDKSNEHLIWIKSRINGRNDTK